DRRDLGLDDVGTVETTTEARLDDGDVYLLVRKVLKRSGSKDIEIARGGLHSPDHGLHGLDQPGKLSMRDHLAVDLNPLADVDQVRAGVEPDLVPAGLQHRRDHRAGAALALGSGDMDRAELFMRVAQLFEQGAHSL